MMFGLFKLRSDSLIEIPTFTMDRTNMDFLLFMHGQTRLTG